MWVFHCHLLCKNVVFVLLKNNYLIHHGEVTCKLIILCTQFKKNTIKWKILILENFRKILIKFEVTMIENNQFQIFIID